MESIKKFDSETFINALKAFFDELNVPIDYIANDPASALDVLGDNYKPSNDLHKLIDDVFVLGMVNDAIFKGVETFNDLKGIKKINEDYDGLLIFGITLKNRANDLPYTRDILAKITRIFNRAFPYTPVTIIFKYGSMISFANSERTKYKQEWREGEKNGKVSLLKDISIIQPHRGHVSILRQLKISNTGINAVKTFNQLYYYWQAVFSISILNKSFYEEIINWFNLAVKEIKIPSQPPGSEKHKDFTVRLIARLIFIWFLKELKVVKDELLIPEFDNGELNKLIIPKKNGTNYYKFILQNMFFNALNCEQAKREKSTFDMYSTSFEYSDDIKEKIFFSPYLNGGLFDIHTNDWCEAGQVNNAFHVPDSLFLDKGNGLNSILSKYKFTIDENTPLEEEIAVDPEMLGRIFENLLAEQNDDTKDAARKNVGAFYTPRPVVSYMCRSTLLKHIEIEIRPENSKQIIQKLLETTVLDPACGSGAFPMGMLEEMMQILSSVDPDGKVWVAEMMKSKDHKFREHIAEMFADGQVRYIKKLGLLRNCLFGVDILEYAIEITKLRCWLSLIVEQRVDFSRQNYNLKHLPNLEFKFYKKNSLLRFYKDKNLNTLIENFDKDDLLRELVNLENQYFISKSDLYETKDKIKEKIINLLEHVVDKKSEIALKEWNSAHSRVNFLISTNAIETEVKSAKKRTDAIAKELAELSLLREAIKDYFIERVVFPGIFNTNIKNIGFDIVIGNPPYVNTKLISSMGLSKKLFEEYGFCDDLYNHFTFRGLELLKKGGLLSYITSDTFLTLQSKKNMRMHFLGIGNQQNSTRQTNLFKDLVAFLPTKNPALLSESKPVQTGLLVREKEYNHDQFLPECQVIEIINTPKAFAALVDTAIFTIKKEVSKENSELIYVDLRKPDPVSFNISQEEWKQIKSSKDNFAGWERVLDKAFVALGHNTSEWVTFYKCDGHKVYIDDKSTLLKFKISVKPYRNAINYAIFSPTEYNCQVFEKIIKPGKLVFDAWWNKIETSKLIETNRQAINNFNLNFEQGNWSIVGLSTDGGVGLQTGDNGRFVGYKSNSSYADKCKVTRIEKLWNAISEQPSLKNDFSLISLCNQIEDVKDVLERLKEVEIWNLFDSIKLTYGLRIFGKGFMYRVVPDDIIFDVTYITGKQKKEGLKGKKTFVPYDKGDREGNRWYLETPYLIDWSEEVVSWLKNHSGHSGIGMPVVRNPQFYFRTGFCWNDVLNPNSSYVKCRLKGQSVNDVKSMSLYDETGLGDKYLVTTINSFLMFKVLREFVNSTVAIQMNDIRKLPIKIPTDAELSNFNLKFDQCLAIKKQYFNEEIDRSEMSQKLFPIEREIDLMVNKLYGIDAEVDIIREEIELESDLTSVDDDE